MKPSKPTQSLKPFIHCPIRFSGKSAPKYRGGGRYWLALVRFRMLAENQLLGTERGRNPASKPDRKACVQSQPEGSSVKNALAIFPLPDGGLPARAQF